MSLTFHWFLPTSGDSRHVVGGGHGAPAGAASADRPPTMGHLSQYRALGIEEFVLSCYPHLEEAYSFGEGVLPRLRSRGLWAHPQAPAAQAISQVPFATAGGR